MFYRPFLSQKTKAPTAQRLAVTVLLALMLVATAFDGSAHSIGSNLAIAPAVPQQLEPPLGADAITTSSVHLAQHRPSRPLRIGIHNFPPDFIVSADGQHCGGTGFEFLKQLLGQQELLLEPVCVTPARMYLLLDKNDIDFSMNIKSTKALVDVSQPPVFIEPPYMMLQLVIYSHSRRSDAVHDGSVAMIRGFDYQGQRQNLQTQGYRPVDMPDAVAAIELFLKGRAEHLITYDGPFQAYIAKRQADADQAEASLAEPLETMSRDTLQQIPTHIVIAAKSPYREVLTQLLQQHAQQHHCRLLKNCGSKG